MLKAERQAKQAIAEAEKLKAEIEAEASIATQQKEKAQKELKSVQSGFLAKNFQPGKYKKKETAKLKESYDAGVTETIGAFIKAVGLKWKSEPTAEILGQQFRMSWDMNKNLSNELKSAKSVRLALPKRNKTDTKTSSIVSSQKDVLPSEHSPFQIERTSTTKRLHPSTTASWLLHIRWN